MGILRVYLALCVIAAHASSVFPWQMHSGKQAVQIFYIISGFYMALVLSTRYTKRGDFYLSRFLRVFPTYWIVCAVTVLWCLITGLAFRNWLLLKPFVGDPLARNGVAGFLIATFSNLTLFGQDWVMFLSHPPGGRLQFTKDFWQDGHPLWEFLLLPQCWSIGLELTFYACVPFLNRWRTRWLVLIAIAAIGARLFAYRQLGLAHDPWNYRFFPFEISWFLFGMLGYRLYAWAKPKRISSPRLSTPLYAASAVMMVVGLYASARIVEHFIRVGWDKEIVTLITYPFWALAIPVLFWIFGEQKFDRVLGELSYPIYLVHYVIVISVEPLMVRLGYPDQRGVVSAVFAVFAAVLLYTGYIAPADKRRHRLTRPATIPTRLPTPSPFPVPIPIRGATVYSIDATGLETRNEDIATEGPSIA